MQHTINKLLEEAELTKLPSLPHVLIKLLNACEQDTACFDTLADIITKDATLSAKVLSVANSPVYGKTHELTSLKQILLFLGLDTIKSIAITATVQQFFSRYSKEKSRFLKGFWEHTLNTALVAKSLAKLTSYHNPEEAYLAGLLHDIGQLIFENYSQHEYSILVYTDTSSDELLKRENEKYNVTHDDIGARLLELWGITDVISESVKYHHTKMQDIQEAHQLVKIINLANSITTHNQSHDEIRLDYSHRLFDLSDSILIDILNNAKYEVKKIAASMDIDIGNSELSEKNDEDKQIQIAEKIRDISLTQGSMQLLTEGVKGIDYSAIQKSTKILFGLDKSCLFVYYEEKNTLVLEHTTAQINKNILNGFEIKCDSASLIATVINAGEPRAYFPDENEANHPVIDKQITSAFKTEGILCVPLIKSGQYVGVVVIGINHQKYDKLMEKTTLLNMYAAEVASRVSSVNKGQKLRKDSISDSEQHIKMKAREIIHEVNNPLAIIRNYLSVLGNRLNDNDPAQNDLYIISEEIDRVGSIILKCDEDINLLAESNKLHEVNLNELISSTNKIMSSSLYATHNVKSHLDLDSQIGIIVTNKNSLKQILTNLIKNSVEAMDEKREISIATRKINIGGKGFVELEVSDTGPGIPENILKNIYKPVTSTKGKSHSGLGLSIIKNLLDDLGSTITCKTGKHGTTFSIHFPLK
ncbi:MAG: HDOD domain-containing protein [Woeseiaceae bacterium]